MTAEFSWSKSVGFAECFPKIGTVREPALIAYFRYRQLTVPQHFLCLIKSVGDQVFYRALIKAFAETAHSFPLTYPYGIRDL